MIPKVPDFHEKLVELRGIMDSDHVPPWIKDTLLGLSERQKELFFWVPEFCSALPASKLLSGLHASDFLCELVEACRAFDWPKVHIVVHGQISESANTTGAAR